MKNVIISPLKLIYPNIQSLKLATYLDILWMARFIMFNPNECPLWSGFNQAVVTQGLYDISRTEILRFLNHNPNHVDTIYSALSYAQYLAEKYQLGICPVTFDQPLYIKAAEIVQSTPHLTKLIIRLRGFLFVMSYTGAISNIKSLGYIICSKVKS